MTLFGRFLPAAAGLDPDLVHGWNVRSAEPGRHGSDGGAGKTDTELSRRLQRSRQREPASTLVRGGRGMLWFCLYVGTMLVKSWISERPSRSTTLSWSDVVEFW